MVLKWDVTMLVEDLLEREHNIKKLVQTVVSKGVKGVEDDFIFAQYLEEQLLGIEHRLMSLDTLIKQRFNQYGNNN